MSAAMRDPYFHVRKEDVHVRSARQANPPFASFDVVLRRDYDNLHALLEHVLDEAVDRWHETCPNKERSLHEWLGLTWDEYADYVQFGAPGLSSVAQRFAERVVAGVTNSHSDPHE